MIVKDEGEAGKGYVPPCMSLQSAPVNSTTGNSNNSLNSTFFSGQTPATAYVKSYPKFHKKKFWSN